MLNRRSFLRGAAAASVAAPVVALFGAYTAKNDREAFVPLPNGRNLRIDLAGLDGLPPCAISRKSNASYWTADGQYSYWRIDLPTEA